MSNIQMVVGLGNPGSQYQNTRHNAGAWFVERLAAQHQITLKPESKFFGYYAKAAVDNRPVHLLIPTTFMNLSGKAVQAVAQFYKIEPENILIAHDELDLYPGTLRLKKGGGHGGHNGLRDSIARLANNRNFWRLRIGIGHPGHKSQVTPFVLGKAPQDQQAAIDDAVDEACREIGTILAGETDKAMQRLHSLTSPFAPSKPEKPKQQTKQPKPSIDSVDDDKTIDCGANNSDAGSTGDNN